MVTGTFRRCAVCSYCGCEAEPVIALLMDDHATVASLIRDAERRLENGDIDRAFEAAADIQIIFGRHSRMEEKGLFAQLQAAGEASDEVAALTAEHRKITAGLSAAAGARDGILLRRVLEFLAAHAQIEDNDLFPFALQRLPNERWGYVEEVHQAMLTRG